MPYWHMDRAVSHAAAMWLRLGRWLVQRSACHVGCAAVHRAALPFTRVVRSDVITDFHAFDFAAALLAYKLMAIDQRCR